MITLPPVSSHAGIVRAYFSVKGDWIETAQIEHALQLDHAQANAAIQYLVKRGYLERKYPKTIGRKVAGLQAYRKRGKG